MKIYKVINNNIVIVLDEQNQEHIYMGRGIGFRKHADDDFDPNLIEKEFVLSLTGTNQQLVELLNEIPLQEIDVAMNIIHLATNKLDKKLNETAVITLSDHIHTAIERSKQGIDVKNVLLWEIKRFYPQEYAIGKLALEIINEQLGVSLQDDEAGFIALHLVNAQMESSVGDIQGLTKFMQEILNIVKYTCNVTFNEDSPYYYRFITHLKFFAQRLLTNTSYDGNENDDLLEIIKKQYQEAYNCVLKIKAFVFNNYSYDLSNEEQCYLVIHIERIIQKNK